MGIRGKIGKSNNLKLKMQRRQDLTKKHSHLVGMASE